MQMLYNLNNFKRHIKLHCNPVSCKGWKPGTGAQTLDMLFAKQSQHNSLHMVQQTALTMFSGPSVSQSTVPCLGLSEDIYPKVKHYLS